jgi:hypothetical protein
MNHTMRIRALHLTACAVLVAVLSGATASVPVPAKSGDTITLRGTVLDPDGKPVAGAQVSVPSALLANAPEDRKPIASASTGPNGQFTLSFKKSAVSPFSVGGGVPGADLWKQTQVIATKSGYGLAFEPYDHVDSAGKLVLKLVKDDAPIQGRVLNLEGAPVRDVKVAVWSISSMEQPQAGPAPVPAQPWPVAPAAPAQSPTTLVQPFACSGTPEPIITARDGRFEIKGIGRDRRVDLRLWGETIGYARIEVTTRAAAPQPAVNPVPVNLPAGAAPIAPPMPARTFGAKFIYTVTDGRSVRGTVRDAATKQPLAGVTVQSVALAGARQGFDVRGVLKCVTDSSGHYQLDSLPKGKGNEIIAIPSDDQPYLMRQAKVDDEPGLKPVTLDLELHKGVFITGRVFDKLTGEPQPARIAYTTPLENPHTDSLPEFRRENGTGVMDQDPMRWESHADGSYRIVAVRGTAILSATNLTDHYRTGDGKESIPALKDGPGFFKLYQPFAPVDQVQTVRQVQVPENAKEVRCDLPLDPGLPVEVSVVDLDDELAQGPFKVRGDTMKPLPGASYHTIDQPVFNALGFGVGDGRMLFILDDAQKLGRAMWINFDDLPDHRITIKLLPLIEVKGKLVTPSGDPMKHSALQAGYVEDQPQVIRAFQTDDKGRFSTLLPIGTRYQLGSANPGGYGGQSLGKPVIPEEGHPIDMGDVKFDTMGQ